MKPSVLLSWPQVEIWASIFVSGQTSNLRRAHKQFMTCFKKINQGGEKEMRKRHFHLRSRIWLIQVEVFFFFSSCWWCGWWVRCFVWLPAGEWLSTGVPWSGAARVHDLQSWEVREHNISRPSTQNLKQSFLFSHSAMMQQHRQKIIILLDQMQGQNITPHLPFKYIKCGYYWSSTDADISRCTRRCYNINSLIAEVVKIVLFLSFFVLPFSVCFLECKVMLYHFCLSSIRKTLYFLICINH